MSKGAKTRDVILDQALASASTEGLEGLSIGGLAKDVGMSKSGLFAHFSSKENLQLQVLDTAVERFIDSVVRPAIREPRGEPRVRALFEHWHRWSAAHFLPGGCVFMSFAQELDDRPGAVRDAYLASQQAWLQTLADAAAIAVDEGHFRPDLDTQQFAFDLHGLLLAHHYFHRLIRDPKAVERSRHAFERILEDASSGASS